MNTKGSLAFQRTFLILSQDAVRLQVKEPGRPLLRYTGVSFSDTQLNDDSSYRAVTVAPPFLPLLSGRACFPCICWPARLLGIACHNAYHMSCLSFTCPPAKIACQGLVCCSFVLSCALDASPPFISRGSPFCWPSFFVSLRQGSSTSL